MASPPSHRRAARALAGALAVLASLTAAWSAVAQTADPKAPSPPLGTEPVVPGEPAAKRDEFIWRYPTFRTSEYIATAVFSGVAIGGLVLPVESPRWTAVNGLDGGVRDTMRLDSRAARKAGDDISDLSLTAGINFMLFDALVVAWWGRGKGSVAYEMAAIDVETMALTAAITSLTKGIAARQRPYTPSCSTDPVYARTDDCEPDVQNRSFFSGHTSSAFAAASLTCIHHANLALYDSPAGDAAACVGAYSIATATGALRIMSDNHYATDVATGAVVGTLVGLGLPWLLHYKDPVPDADAATKTRDEVSIQVIPGPTSATVVGTF